MSSVTDRNEARAAEALLPLVYGELRRLASHLMAGERRGHTLQTTALVHEAYLRLADDRLPREWNSPAHYYAALAEAMRRILIDHARRNRSQKRSGHWQRSSLDLDQCEIPVEEPPDEVLALDEALERLAKHQPLKTELVKLRFFAGLTMEQAAGFLGISLSTAERHWAYARAWLYRELHPE